MPLPAQHSSCPHPESLCQAPEDAAPSIVSPPAKPTLNSAWFMTAACMPQCATRRALRASLALRDSAARAEPRTRVYQDQRFQRVRVHPLTSKGTTLRHVKPKPAHSLFGCRSGPRRASSRSWRPMRCRAALAWRRATKEGACEGRWKLRSLPRPKPCSEK